MKILHVTDCFLPRLGGIERQVHALAERQHLAGHDVSVVTAVGGTGATGLDATAADEAVPFTVHRPAARRRSEWTSTRALSQGRAVVRDGGFDVVHAHVSVWSPLAAACVEAACAAGVPTAVTLHSVWGPYANTVMTSANKVAHWQTWPVAWSAVSTVAAGPLQRQLPPGTPVAMLPNGVDSAYWAQPWVDRPADAVRIAAVMRFAARKRAQALIDMLEEARSRIPDRIALEAVLIGDGARHARVAKHIKRDGLDWISLPGRATPTQVRDLLGRSDLFVAPAVLESFGIAALEARCAGVPVVAFAQSGVRDIVTHGREGLLASTDEQMIDAIVRLAIDADLRRKLAAHNRATPAPFDWPSALGRAGALYAQAHALAVAGPRGGALAKPGLLQLGRPGDWVAPGAAGPRPAPRIPVGSGQRS
ncbi:MAG: glycosyl transferase group 1 [Pseudonocardiales bacterium]|nr:glycosyl transferase group 1 [Pseudonocardiales bacterium]